MSLCNVATANLIHAAKPCPSYMYDYRFLTIIVNTLLEKKRTNDDNNINDMNN